MNRKTVSPEFFEKLYALAEEYGVSLQDDYDNYNQIIYYTGIMTKDNQVFEIMEDSDFEDSDDEG